MTPVGPAISGPAINGPAQRRTRAALLAASGAASAAFLALTWLVVVAPAGLVDFDASWSSRAFAFTGAHPAAEQLVRAASWLGNTSTVAALTAAVTLACARSHRLALGVWLAVTVAGGSALNWLVKVVIGRLRPPSAGAIASAHGYSFPSGHTQAATVTYVAVVLVVAWAGRPVGRAARTAGATGVTLLVAACGASRVLLGVHWPTDVLGGWLIGSAWVTGATVVLLSRPTSHGGFGGRPGETERQKCHHRASGRPNWRPSRHGMDRQPTTTVDVTLDRHGCVHARLLDVVPGRSGRRDRRRHGDRECRPRLGAAARRRQPGLVGLPAVGGARLRRRACQVR